MAGSSEFLIEPSCRLAPEPHPDLLEEVERRHPAGEDEDVVVGDLDDLAISGDQIKMLRLERMSGSSAWGRIHMIDGRDIVLRFSVAKRSLVITAEED